MLIRTLFLALFFSASLLQASPTGNNFAAIYDVYEGPSWLYEIDFRIIPNGDDGSVHIRTSVTGPRIKEQNDTFLSITNKLLKITQSSENDLENKYFDWTLETKGRFAKISYAKKNGPINTKLKALSSNTYPMQAIFYLLQTQALPENTYLRLLIPPSFVLPLRHQKIRTETILIGGTQVESTLIRFQTIGFLSRFFPPYKLWLSQEPPYLIYQYFDGAKTVKLRTLPSKH